MRWLTAVALAAVLASAGCSGIALDAGDGSDSELVTPAPIPTERTPATTVADGVRFPPGVDPTGLDPTRLAAAHAAAARNRSYSLRLSDPLRSTPQDDDRLRMVVGQESASRYRATTSAVVPGEPNASAVVADVFVANGTANWVFYGERPRNDAVLDSPGERRYAEHVSSVIERYLTVGTFSVARSTRDGDPVVEVFGTAPGGELRGVSDYRVSAVVGMDGFVHSLTASYRVDGEPVAVEFRYDQVGTTTVSQPSWVGTTDAAS